MVPSLDQEILELRARYRSHEDPTGRSFVPLADALRRAGRLDEAEAVVREGLRLHPESSVGFLVASWIHRERGEASEAAAALREVLHRDPLNVVALRHLGLLHREAGEEEEAEGLMRRAGAIDGGAGEAWDLGRLPPLGTPPRGSATAGAEPDPSAGGEEAGEGAEGEEEGLAVGHSPSPPSDEWSGVAWVPEMEAEEDYPFPPEEMQTRTMAEVYAAQGLVERAVEIYEELLARDPGSPELQDRLAELRGARGGGGELRPEEAPPPAAEAPVLESADVDAELHLPSSHPEVESPFAWTEEGGEGVEEVPISRYFDELLSWLPTPAGAAEVEEAPVKADDARAEPGFPSESEAVAPGVVQRVEAEAEVGRPVDPPKPAWGVGEVDDLSGSEDGAPTGVALAEAAAGSTVLEGGPRPEGASEGAGAPGPLAVPGETAPPEAPLGSAERPVPVAELAPAGPLPHWVPVESLAPDRPIPHWVPVEALAPDRHPGERRSPPPPPTPPPPDADEAEFRAWLERLRL